MAAAAAAAAAAAVRGRSYVLSLFAILYKCICPLLAEWHHVHAFAVDQSASTELYLLQAKRAVLLKCRPNHSICLIQ